MSDTTAWGQTGDAPLRRAGGVDFHREIKPILEARCFSCHQGSKVKGGLRLDTRSAALAGGASDGPAVTPHRPEESSILRRISSTDPEEIMPAKLELNLKYVREQSFLTDMKIILQTVKAIL
jgi:hypothetical protein